MKRTNVCLAHCNMDLKTTTVAIILSATIIGLSCDSIDIGAADAENWYPFYLQCAKNIIPFANCLWQIESHQHSDYFIDELVKCVEEYCLK